VREADGKSIAHARPSFHLVVVARRRLLQQDEPSHLQRNPHSVKTKIDFHANLHIDWLTRPINTT
jgi:hypothetical protein